MKPFWVVWNPSCGLPRMKHNSFSEAKSEAFRLSQTNPGQEFFVLGSCGVAKKIEVTWTEVEDTSDIPF